jgi:hypothetical protein
MSGIHPVLPQHFPSAASASSSSANADRTVTREIAGDRPLKIPQALIDQFMSSTEHRHKKFVEALLDAFSENPEFPRQLRVAELNKNGGKFEAFQDIRGGVVHYSVSFARNPSNPEEVCHIHVRDDAEETLMEMGQIPPRRHGSPLPPPRSEAAARDRLMVRLPMLPTTNQNPGAAATQDATDAESVIPATRRQAAASPSGAGQAAVDSTSYYETLDMNDTAKAILDSRPDHHWAVSELAAQLGCSVPQVSTLRNNFDKFLGNEPLPRTFKSFIAKYNAYLELNPSAIQARHVKNFIFRCFNTPFQERAKSHSHLLPSVRNEQHSVGLAAEVDTYLATNIKDINPNELTIEKFHSLYQNFKKNPFWSSLRQSLFHSPLDEAFINAVKEQGGSLSSLTGRLGMMVEYALLHYPNDEDGFIDALPDLEDAISTWADLHSKITQQAIQKLVDYGLDRLKEDVKTAKERAAQGPAS